MTLRLVLVSLVAALGLTIPGAPMIENWVASTQNWMNARFADWDTRDPQTADYVIVSDYYDAEHLAPRPETQQVASTNVIERPAIASVDAKTISSSTPAMGEQHQKGMVRPVAFNLVSTPRFEVLVMGDDLNLGIALQFKLGGEEIGLVSPDSLAVSRRPFEPIAVPENLCEGIAFDLNRKNEGISLRPIRAARPAPSIASFGPLEASPSLYFAGELTTPAPFLVTRASAQSSVPALPQTRPSDRSSGTQPLEIQEDLSIEIAGEMLSENDGFGVIARLNKSRGPSVTPRFRALEVSQDLQVGLAYDLNRRNDGLTLPRSSEVKTAKAPAATPLPTHELSRAVKLTRDAVFAWVTVFTGPAIVTASQSN